MVIGLDIIRIAYHRLVVYSKGKSRAGLYEFISFAVDKHNIIRKEKVINIGAGGKVAEFIASLGISAVSLDCDKERGPDILANIEDLIPIADRTFDVVFLIEVLEHIKRPSDAVAEIYRILKPGGVLIGSTPFVLGLHDAPHDFFRFTEYGLRSLLSGYRIELLSPRNNSVASASALLSRIFVEGSRTLNLRILIFAPLIIIICEALHLISKVINDETATTGFVFIARKTFE